MPSAAAPRPRFFPPTATIITSGSTSREPARRPPPSTATGPYHLGILCLTRAALANALQRLCKAGSSLDGASGHGVSLALYLGDPDGIGVELSWNRPQAEWPCTPAGGLAAFVHPLDLPALLSQAA